MNPEQLKHELVSLCDGAHVLAVQILGKSDDARDVVHDALTKTLNSPEIYNAEKGPLKPWFLRVVRNRCIDLLRQTRPGEATIDDLLDPGLNPEQILENGQAGNAIKNALASLPGDQRQILVLRDYLDLSYAELAKVLNIAEGTVMSRLHRARLSLKTLLAGKHYEN